MERKIIDIELAKKLLPRRAADGNKGSFGKALLLVGSQKYRGAAHLATEAALRGGAGYVTLASEDAVITSVLSVYPETLFIKTPPFSHLSAIDIKSICDSDAKNSATLIGCGASVSPALAELIIALLESGNTPLVIDADAINALSEDKDRALAAIAASKREVILTPHPLEFARISGLTVEEISSDREAAANELARRAKCTVILKGNGTVVTDGNTTLINSSGSCALAKAGSGDTLAGLLVSLLSSGVAPIDAAALAAYIHGAAGDALAERLSTFGVTPSDLPRTMAEIIATVERQKF